MNDPAPARELFYPLMLRVVLGGIVSYRTMVIECTETPSGLSLEELTALFSITREDDWIKDTLDELNFAKDELQKKVDSLSRRRQVTVHNEGFFITVRPRYNEVEMSALQL